MTTSSQGKSAFIFSLKTPYQRNFSKLLLGELISLIGDQIAMVALLLLVLQRTGQGTAVGITAILLEALPILIFGPIGGALADRFPRQYVGIAMDVLRFIASLLLVWSSNLLLIYFLVLLLGTGRAMFTPAVRAFITQIVPAEELVRCNGLFSTIFNISYFVGPALGGVLVAFWGSNWAFVLNAISFLVSALCLLWIPFQRVATKQKEDKKSSFLRDVLGGLTIVWHARSTRGVTLSLIAIVLAGGMANIASIGLAERVFHAGSQGYGFLSAGFGLGILAGGLYVSFGPQFKRIHPWLARSIGVMTLAMAATAIAPGLLIATLAFVLQGIGNAVENIVNYSLLQTTVPPEKQGRAFSGLFTFASLANVPSLAVGGVLLDLLDARIVFAATAVLMFLAFLVAWVTVGGPFSTDSYEERHE